MRSSFPGSRWQKSCKKSVEHLNRGNLGVTMQVGEVKCAEDDDFERLKQMCRCHDGWKQDYNKNSTTVWSKSNDVSDFKLIKVGRGCYYYYRSRET